MLQEEGIISAKDLLTMNAAVIAGLLVLFAIVPSDITSQTAYQNKLAVVILGSLAFFLFAIPVALILWKDVSDKKVSRDFTKTMMALTIAGFGILGILMLSILIAAQLNPSALGPLPSH